MTENTETAETCETALKDAHKNLITLTGMYPGIDQNHYFCRVKRGVETALALLVTPNLNTEPLGNSDTLAVASDEIVTNQAAND